MADTKYAVGDVVYLKSGSARMTVTEVLSLGGDNQTLTVVWVHFESQEIRSLTAAKEAFNPAGAKGERGAYPHRDEVPF